MADRIIPTQEVLRDVFDYVFSTGALCWKKRNDRNAQWNSRWAGKIAGSASAEGYLMVGLNGTIYAAHRIVWVMFNGSIPSGVQVDHINKDKTDNRIENLRLASPSQNRRNAPKRKDNRSGFRGVDFSKTQKLWRARITADKKTHHLGLFPTAESAHAAYVEASGVLHKEFASRG